MARFNYDAPAELFAGRSQRGPRPMMYQRFDTGAKALRYAIEQMPPANLLGSVLEVNERRYGHLEIRAHYDAPEYPYKRKAVKVKKEPKAKAEAKTDAKAEPKAETKLAKKPAQAKRQLETAGASSRA